MLEETSPDGMASPWTEPQLTLKRTVAGFLNADPSSAAAVLIAASMAAALAFDVTLESKTGTSVSADAADGVLVTPIKTELNRAKKLTAPLIGRSPSR